MAIWPSHPLIYEINTRIWLGELSHRYQTQITLANVPDAEWDAITAWSPDAVWLMGVWERSARGREIAINHESLLTACREALPDLNLDDMVGSPYCVRRYRVDEHLGGPGRLARAAWGSSNPRTKAAKTKKPAARRASLNSWERFSNLGISFPVCWRLRFKLIVSGSDDYLRQPS